MSNVQNGAPAWLAPDYRYAGDDWAGDNALTFIVYVTPPVLAADGVTVTTPGVTRPIDGCTVTGTLQYLGAGRRASPPSGFGLVSMTGFVVDATGGVISLSLPAAQTIFPRQEIDAWGDPRRALLIVQPRIVDGNGTPVSVTVGLQPLFVF